MSFSYEQEEKFYVISYKEWIFTFMVFSAILFFLYPKELLKEQILAENSNYDLSMLYLKDLLAQSPKDESLMLLLAKQSLRSGKKDLSIRLLDLLLESKKRETREEATLLKYELEKEDYFYLKDKKRQKKQRRRLKKLFLAIFNGKMYNPKDIDKWYQEAQFVQSKEGMQYFLHNKMYNKKDIDKWYQEAQFVASKEGMQYFLHKKMEQEPDNIELLKKYYYLEQELHHKEYALRTLHTLQKFDRKKRLKWLEAEYSIYMRAKEYAKAKLFLLKESENSVFWTKKLASFYLMRKSYGKASDIYTKLFRQTADYRVKRFYFYQSIRALQGGNLLLAAAKKAHYYENYYLHDRDVRIFLLKTYIATGQLDYAKHFAKKILRELKE